MARLLNNILKGALVVVGLALLAPLFSEHTAQANPWTEPVMSDYIKTPPFLTSATRPNIMIILDNSGSMNSQAYDEAYNGEPYNNLGQSLFVTSTQDDMEENLSGALRDGPASADDLDFGTDYIGIRFQDVPIEQGDIVEGAYIRFTAQGNTSAASDLEIRAEATDDAVPLDVNNNGNISNRTYTTASASWTPEAWTDEGAYRTVDISAVVQEVVDRPGWAQGNSMLFCVSGASFPGTTTGWRQSHSREAGEGLGPTLVFIVRDSDADPTYTRYYGYYNPDYFYNYSSGVFNPQYKKVGYNYASQTWSVEDLSGNSTTKDDSDIAPASAANGLWDGNWLNWCSMRRVDVLRKVLMGGLATSRQGGGNSRNQGESPNGWEYHQYMDTSGEGPAVSPYNGDFRYYIDDGYIRARNVSSDTNLASYDIDIEKDFSTDPDDFYEGNLAGILQRIGDRARWGNMWFNYGTGSNRSGGYVANTIGDANMSSLITDLQNTACTTWTPLAETFYVAMQHFKQEEVAGGLDYANNAEMNSNLGDDPYYDSVEREFIDCAKSFVLLLTDGEATRDGMIPNVFKDYDNDNDPADSCSGDCTSDHLDDLALYARTNDLRSDLDGDQNIVLYTVFAFDDNANARRLLMDAARNGGFEDMDGDNRPDGDYSDPPENRMEWDKDSDGMPDTYFEASDGYVLKDQLLRAIQSIYARASSGTAASVISNSRTGEGAVTQSIFYPAWTEGENTVEWVGQVHALFVDGYGNLREDTLDNDTIDYDHDRFILFEDDDDAPVKKYLDVNGNGVFEIGERCDDTNGNGECDDGEPLRFVEEGQIQDIEFLWNSSDWLNEITDVDITQQRSYTSTSQQRHIFTFVDLDGNMVADSGDQVDFVATSDPSWDEVNSANSFYAYIHPYTPYTPDIATDHEDFEAYVRRRVARTVNFVRGQDQGIETVGSTDLLLPAYRSRQIDYDADGDVNTWRLGDIIYSTPTLAGAPAEDYDLIWRDGSYLDFYLRYRERRNVIYVGANDGMVHAFNGGFYDRYEHAFLRQPLDDDGDPDSNYHRFELGAELWAYVPRNLLPHLHWMTDTEYGHIYYNDLKPRIFDAKIFPADGPNGHHPNGWGTVMVTGMRFGGGRIPADIDKTDGAYNSDVDPSMTSAYAIFDITDPEQEPILMAEITFPELGFTTCVPGVVPMRNLDPTQSGLLTPSSDENRWILLFGSGPIEADGPFTTAMLDGTSSQRAVMYGIDLVELGTNRRVVALDSSSTSTYSSTDPGPYYWTQFSEANSMVAQPVSVDFDLDMNTDVVYFGTTFGSHANGWNGRMRRIIPTVAQITSPWNWENDSILIDLTDVVGNQGQPVTAQANVGIDEQDNRWVYFGTGRYLSARDATNTDQQAFYGIMEPYDTDSGGNKTFDYTDTVQYSDLMDVSDIEVYESGQHLGNYSGDFMDLQVEIASDGGWRMDFTYEPEQERNLGQATLAGEVLTFTTYLPSADLCSIGGASVAYGLYYTTGTAYEQSIFGTDSSDTDGDGNERVLKRTELGSGLTVSPTLHVGRQDGTKVFIQSSTGAIDTEEHKNPGEIKSRELYWSPDTGCDTF